jgi:hypothetical protein
MVHLVVTHGRSHEFDIPVLTQEPLEAALRFGLERVRPPDFTRSPVSMAFYGDAWRPDAVLEAAPGDPQEAVLDPATREPTELQREIAADMLASAPGPESAEAVPELFGWDSLNALATKLDEHLHTGDLITRLFLEDVELYFTDETRRRAAIDRVVEAVNAAGGDVILLGHSLGSVVVYDALSEHPDLPAPGLITLGSPLGLPTVRRRLQTRRFPSGVARWVNVYDPRDFVTGREPLQEHFPAADGLMVEDLEIEGKAPSFLDVTASHDGRVYLSSMGLARALRDMIAAGSAAEAEPNSA